MGSFVRHSMPHGKRIKCAGEADEQLIADLENQLENRANQAGNAPGSPKGSGKPQIYENDEAYVYPEDEEESNNLLCYILCGIAFGALILGGGWFFFFRNTTPAVPPTQEPALGPDGKPVDPVDPATETPEKDPNAESPPDGKPPQDGSQFVITPTGIVDPTKEQPKGCLQKTTDFVKDNALYLGAGAAVVGGVGYWKRKEIQRGVAGAVNWTKNKLGFKGKGPIAAPLTMEDCRAKGMVLKNGQCVPTTWSEHPKLKLQDMGNAAVDANASVYDTIGAGGAGLLNKVGMKVDPNSAKVSSYSYGKVVAASITTVIGAFGIYKLYNFIRNRFWPKEAEDPNKPPQPEEQGMCGKACSGIASFMPESVTKKCDWAWTNYRRWILGALSAIGLAFVWFLPAIASCVGLGKALSCVTGPISAGKGALMGMVGMGGSGPILG